MLSNDRKMGVAGAKPMRDFDWPLDRKLRSRGSGDRAMPDTDWLLDRSRPQYTGSGGEAHARGLWGVSPQSLFFKRAEQTEGMRSE
jgi:hypothetical protein